MIDVTKEQIKESLERLRDYGYWMYYSKDAIELLNKRKIKHKDHEFSLSVDKNGYIIATLENGTRCRYNAVALTHPLEENRGIDNIDIKILIMNKDELAPESIDYFNELGIFVCSYWQRAIAFTFFSRMQPETIDGISEELTKAKNKQI